MKKIFLLLSLAFLISGLQAQKVTLKTGGVKRIKPNTRSEVHTLVFDTLTQYYDRAHDFLVLYSGVAGYVYGTAFYTDTAGKLAPISDATGCHYDDVGSANITEVLLWAGDKVIVGTPDSIAVRVYS